MSLIGWTGTSVPDSNNFTYTNDVAPEYEIVKEKDDKFFVRRLVAECADAGPYASFKDAETLVLKMLAVLVFVEEQTWLELSKEVS